jgi:hypothetical protein
LNACDVLIVHVDADVARGRYQEANITPTPLDLPLPCEQTCPPARGSSDALRSVVLSWCGESSVPEPVVLCVPSKSTEAWVVASIFPSDSSVASTRVPFECLADPESRLAQQPKNRRFSKKTAHYEDRAKALQNAWPAIVAPNRLGEALRFQNEFLGVPAVAGSQRTE